MKMKKWKLILVTAIASVFVFSLTACEWNLTATPDNGEEGNILDVADALGYSDEREWITSTSVVSSEARTLYLEAKADGYTGSFVDFLKEINYSVSSDDSVALAKAFSASVSVYCDFEKITYSYGFTGRPVEQVTSATQAGSGVIYSMEKENGNAYIITNYHVVYNVESSGNETTAHISDSISVYLYGSLVSNAQNEIPATYVGGSMENDIAVLLVENSDLLKSSSATSVKAANSDGLTAGEHVYAIGNADSKGISVTTGVVSVESEYIEMLLPDERTATVREVIRTDAAVNHGNSGGGLFNADGKLIGIVDARSEEDGIESFGYAIPGNLAVSVAQNIIDNSAINSSKGALRATFGITIQTVDSQAIYDEQTQKTYVVETVKVAEVVSGKAADGYLMAEDILYSVQLGDNDPLVLTRRRALDHFLYNVRKGDTVSVTVYRNGKLKTVEITFDKDEYFTLFD